MKQRVSGGKSLVAIMGIGAGLYLAMHLVVAAAFADVGHQGD